MLGQRFLRVGPSTRLFNAAKSQSRSLLTSTTIRTTATRNAPRAGVVTQRHHFSTSKATALPRQSPRDDSEVARTGDGQEIVSILEGTASKDFLSQIPTDPDDRLRRAVTLLIQIVLYLGAPRGGQEEGMNFLMAFGTAAVGPKSEIARARRASAEILRAVIRDINSIPKDHPLRAQAKDMFEKMDVITMLSDVHLSKGSEDIVADFTHFWPTAMDPLLEVLDALNAAGYGVDMEQMAAEVAAEAEAKAKAEAEAQAEADTKAGKSS